MLLLAVIRREMRGDFYSVKGEGVSVKDTVPMWRRVCVNRGREDEMACLLEFWGVQLGVA